MEYLRFLKKSIVFYKEALSFGKEVYGMDPTEFIRKEVLPFMSLYVLTYLGIVSVAFSSKPLFLQLILILFFIINAWVGFNYYFDKRKNKLTVGNQKNTTNLRPIHLKCSMKKGR
ncbi:hypothetical protein [Sphingobacterium sp. IITKGP-BTPF85]|uniref:hypothetical protein n=1 Tax=Sphingobacterium sp. IITKGP-BTPF85 TaxID=1338009 RepID=UPI00038A0929|nr:hypothetical protein [Sphingobacterium sp. IITKGP-BTPF85]KKX47454.1 hypothetical protein L950_0226440 [Sphingobacterium sp. IITKGP-BTPF85]